MSYLFLGIGLLGGLILLGKWFVATPANKIVGHLKWIGLVVGGLLAVTLIASGRGAMIFWLLPVLLPWLLRLRVARRTAKTFSRMQGGGGSDGVSRVESRFLDMQLDHASGDMRGRVRAGRLAGQDLQDLALSDLVSLHRDYVTEDTESARLLAAFLDRNYPDWRAGTGSEAPGGEGAGADFSGSAMSRDEAMRVLGLSGDPNEDEIKAAHHRLIAGLHPDRGGSDYLAAKINQARDTLLAP